MKSDPMSRISRMESLIETLAASVAKLMAADMAKPDKPAKPVADKPRKQTLVMPLSDRNRDLALLAWGCLTEDGKAKPGSFNQASWCEAIDELDTERTFPSHCKHLGATLRALLAEQAGMSIRWSSTTLYGQNEPESRHYNRPAKGGA